LLQFSKVKKPARKSARPKTAGKARQDSASEESMADSSDLDTPSCKHKDIFKDNCPSRDDEDGAGGDASAGLVH
jgi:hypothetical protein